MCEKFETMSQIQRSGCVRFCNKEKAPKLLDSDDLKAFAKNSGGLHMLRQLKKAASNLSFLESQVKEYKIWQSMSPYPDGDDWDGKQHMPKEFVYEF